MNPTLPRLACGLFFLLTSAAAAHAQTAPQFYADGAQAYKEGSIDKAKTNLQHALEVDRNFRPATALLNRIALEQKGAAGAAPQAGGAPKQELAKLVVPVQFKNTALSSALEYIRQNAEQQSGGKVRLNFVMHLSPEQAAKQISLNLDHAPVPELLRYVGELGGVSFRTEQYAIVVTPAGAAAPVQ